MTTDLRNLPEPVLARLADHLGERGDTRHRRGIDTIQRGRLLEARHATVELRRTDDGLPILDGYATVYEYPYDVAGGPPYGWTETMAAGACTKSLRERDDVRLLFDHEGIPLARTKSRTLTLDSDDIGLHCTTPEGLDTASPLVQSLVSAMGRGDLDEMSLAFRVLRQEWNDEYTERRILEVQLFDVSVVTYPANPATVAQLRGDDTPAEKRTSVAYARAVADQLR